ncbi:MAG: hypothetical protein ACLGHL_10440, partial [Actinomycetota bacterium]
PSLLRGNIPIFDELGDAYYIAENLSRVACALAPLGHPEEATRLIGYAESLMEELGTRHQWANHMNAETLVQIRSQAAPDDVESWLRSGAALKQEAAVALAVRALG